MGGKTSSESKTTVDPELLNLYKKNYSNATSVADNYAYVPYTGERVAGFTPTQTEAQGVLGAIGRAPATSLATTDLTPYMNPFQKDVIDASINQNEYARNIAQVKDQQAATRAGSFQGAGTRQGVAMGETNAAYDRNNQQNLAALNSANFGQAQSAATNDIQNIFKQQVARGGILSAIGDQQQQNQQAQDEAAYQEFLRQIQAPLQAQQIRNQALGMIPMQQTQSTTSTSSPGLGGILGGIGSLGLGLATGGTSLFGTGLLGGAGGLFGGALAGQASGPLMGWT